MSRIRASRGLLSCLCFTLTSILLFYYVVTQSDSPYLTEDQIAPNANAKEISSFVSNAGVSTTGKITVTPTHYLIFDAIEHKSSLNFLDNFSTKWTVILVNPASRRQRKSCRKCQVVDKSWTPKILDKRGTSEPWRELPSYARDKAVAILYALWNSAEWIYVTDSQGLPDENTLLSICSNKTRTGPVYHGPNQMFEPCEHFMDPYTWHGLKTAPTQGLYSVKPVGTETIHMVVNSCYRTHMDAQSWEKAFSTRAPRPYLMAGTFSSINFHNVVVSRKMAWTLVASLLPRSYESQSLGRQRVWLNFLIQRIVWETGGMIGFMPTSRYPTSLDCPSCEVNETLHDIGLAQMDKLSKWRCNQTDNLAGCLKQLARDFPLQTLSNSKIPSSELTGLLDAWVNVWVSFKFPMVSRVPLTDAQLNAKHAGIRLRFTPPKSMHLSSNVSLPPNTFADLCKTKGGKKYAPYIPEEHPITDILLIIIFNYKWLVGNTAQLDYVYGRHFKHVLYCAESTGEFQNHYASKFPKNPVSFLEVDHTTGYKGQKCMSEALLIGYQVSGFLQISDDVIMNVWNVRTLPRSIPWFQAELRVAPIDWKNIPCISNQKKGWAPWTWKHGKKASLRVYNTLQQMRRAPDTGEKVSVFLQTLHNVTGCERCLMYEPADIYYIPADMAADYVFFTNVFSVADVFLEIAIPTVLVGLTSDQGLYRLRGNYLWYDDRKKYKDVYSEFDHFLHPWKFSMFSSPTDTSFYCSRVLGRIDEDLKRP